MMNEEFLSIKEESKLNPSPKEEIKGGSSNSSLIILTLILFFIALNVWGYYFYKKGFFGAGADIAPTASPTPAIKNPDSIYMIPGI